ncbi:hypothetical protein TB2_000301 [Malus domestica]
MEVFYYMVFGILAAVVAAAELSKRNKDRINTPSTFNVFKNNYLFVYSLMMVGDWLQGPYVYYLDVSLGYGRVLGGWLTDKGVDAELRKFAFFEVIEIFDHSLVVKLGVHFFLWGGAIQLFGTKRHHDKWLSDTENYAIKGCFAMSELGHGSNIC